METTFQLFRIVEDEEVFVPLTNIHQNLTQGKFMQYEQFSDDEDGTFPRVEDYTRIANRIEDAGACEFLHWHSGRKMKSHNGYCTLIRQSRWDNEGTLIFDKPIKVSFGEINGEHIIREVSEIEGEFYHDWYFLKNGRQDKIANGCEIYFDCKTFKFQE